MHMPREKSARPRKRMDEAVAAWKEKEFLDAKPVDAGVIVLRTTGCDHYRSGGCSMCGYNVESAAGVTPENILTQFEKAMKTLAGVKMLKIYTSGSFLDERELPRNVAKHILSTSAEDNVRVLFETRPEFVTPASLNEVLSSNENLEIALGLESMNDRVLRYSINKGFSRADYEAAAKAIAEAGIDLRTYILLKPPFLTEAEAIADSIESIKYASRFSRTISLNPVNVQKGTLVERLWRNWAYRPPWLWSVLEVLKGAHSDGMRLVCEPTGGGKERGAHNCGSCDETILASIKAYSESQDIDRLGFPDCECRDIWSRILELDGFVMGGIADLHRFFRQRG